MSLDAMLADLPRRCDTDIERDAEEFQIRWTGYKLHIDIAEHSICGRVGSVNSAGQLTDQPWAADDKAAMADPS